MKRAVMVSGAGRSGTSTMAGSMTMLGLHVPQPEVPADDSNPRGFFETQWVVDFHKRLLDQSPVVRTIDSRPEALGLAAQRCADPEALAELDVWLDGQAGHDQLVIKDPRAFWFHDLWRTAVESRGGELSFLMMLRHPVEVVKSRDTHYVADRGEEFRRLRATANVAGWCNVAFASEEVSRPSRRVFVRYTDLLTDWRRAMAPVVAALDLEVNTDLSTTTPHAVDDFIDSDLRRSQTAWDDYDIPTSLRDLAEAVWAEVNRLADDATDAAALAALDTLRQEYLRMHDYAVAIALDHTNTREVLVRRQVRAGSAQQYERRIAELEAQVASGSQAARSLGRAVRRRITRG